MPSYHNGPFPVIRSRGNFRADPRKLAGMARGWDGGCSIVRHYCVLGLLYFPSSVDTGLNPWALGVGRVHADGFIDLEIFSKE